VDFARDLAPLLERACGRCHAGGRASGGLRLETAALLGEVVVPGQSGRSPLVRRLLGQDGERMPRDAPPLRPEEVELVRRWIDEGAAGIPRREGHWAYRAPRRPSVPAGPDLGWARTPIDRFILARLRRAGLRPAPAAGRQTMIRRVTLDLTGLPPTPAEIDAYLADRAPGAYQRLVDRLLGSPRFGERWAVPWLDAARYADSNGYEKDGRRSVWPYRDWVVAALNADLPFDRFTIEQLAGDLLPGATTDQKIATGFHRNTLFNEEAGVDPAEARWERLVDRAETTATVWLGTTLACARCHDHKFDPFTRRDFYGLLAFFENAAEVDLPLPTPAQAARQAELAAERARLDGILGRWTPELGAAQRRWETELAALAAAFVPVTPVAANGALGPLARLADGSVRVEAAPAGGDVHRVLGETALEHVTGLRLEALPDPRLPGGGPGRGRDGNFLLSALELEVAPRVGADTGWEPVTWRAAFADDRPRDEPERYGVESLLPGAPRAATLDPETTRGWGVSAVYDGARHFPRQAVLIPDRPFGFPGGTRLRVRLRYEEATGGEVIGRFRLSVTGHAAPEAVVSVGAPLRPALERSEAQRSILERDRLAEAYRAVAPALAPLRARRAALTAEEAALGIPSTLALAPLAGVPARTALREGGSFTRPGAAVAAALPEVLVSAAPGPLDRLALARWLVSPDNPLTARVVVNRIWAQYFGRGLVETAEDFGTRGAPPSHPELLDWLATELVRQGWHQKAIHRLIVTSAVYTQSAEGRRAGDPEDRLLGRFPRQRLEAEMVRDLALAASGLLDRRMGGPPVFPPQPPGVFTPPNSTEIPWPASDGGDRHRRALYTFWRRTAPYPSAALFDAPSRETCSMRRGRTTTPLQALVTLNDPVFWEAARALGRRMMDAGALPAERIAHGFRLCTGRWPDASERRPLERLYRRQRARGASPAAALALVGNVLLNLDETLTRN
jgi:hypothetical protein